VCTTYYTQPNLTPRTRTRAPVMGVTRHPSLCHCGRRPLPHLSTFWLELSNGEPDSPPPYRLNGRVGGMKKLLVTAALVMGLSGALGTAAGQTSDQ
jgi:hypothetical protein